MVANSRSRVRCFAAVIALATTCALAQTDPDVNRWWEQLRQQADKAQLDAHAQGESHAAAKSPPGDSFKWVRALTNLKRGGWTVLGLYDDGKMAVLVTKKDAMRAGDVATVWLRVEFRDAQNDASKPYRSLVSRDEFDCLKRVYRNVSGVHYAQNDLAGESVSDTVPDNTWTAILPGTRGEDWIDWACRVTGRGR